MAHKILLTGGAGYIGSHTYVALVEAGFEVVILDNFSNSHPSVLIRLGQITRQNQVFATKARCWTRRYWQRFSPNMISPP
jgi:UDP-glucose 4-epimerase